MSMERWNPFRDMDMMRQAMDRWFDDRMPERGFFGNQSMNVPVDLHETDNGYELIASVPGLHADDLDITVNRDTVTIRGKVDQNDERKQGNYIYRERRSGSFHRVVRLPEMVDAEQVEANLEHGELRITLPRLQQQPNRRVQVRPGAMGNQLGVNQGMTGTGSTGTNMQPGMSGMGSTTGMSSTGTSGSTTGMGSTGSTMTGQGSSGSTLSSGAGQGHPGSSFGSTSGTTGGSYSSSMTGQGSSGMGSGSGMSGSGMGSSSQTTGVTNTGPNVGATGTTMGGTMGSSDMPRTGMSGQSQSQGSSTTQRPDVMNRMTSTQMDELNRAVNSGSQGAFRAQARSYGWDDQTIDQVWSYMNHRPSQDEAQRAFGNQSQSQGGQSNQTDQGQRPTNSY